MNFTALKVYVNDNWEYLDLNSDLSFKKSNGLYLFSEVEYSRSTNIKLPNTDRNLKILDNPNIPILYGYYMTVKLEALLTIESGEIYGHLLVNKSQEHFLEALFVFDDCDILDYINDKNIEDIGLNDNVYSIEWQTGNITPANSVSLESEKIAIIPYLTDGIVGHYGNYTTNAEILYKAGGFYPSIKLSSLIYDCLGKAKQDINSNVDISHLFDENTSFERNNYWIITDKLQKKGTSAIRFSKNGNLTITEGLGDYSGGLRFVEKDAYCITGDDFWGGWGINANQLDCYKKFKCAFFQVKYNKPVSIRFYNLPQNTDLIIAQPYQLWGYVNLKTHQTIRNFSDLVPVRNGDTITIYNDVCFSFFNKDDAKLLYNPDNTGRIYFEKEYNDGVWSFSASLSYEKPLVPEEEEEPSNMLPWDTWKISDNPIEVSVMDLIKTFAYLTGTQFIYEPDNDKRRGKLKFVRTKVLSTKEVEYITKINSLEKRVGDYSKKETIDFDTADYVEKMNSTRVIRTYETSNECLDDKENEHTSPFDEGALITLENYKYIRPNGTSTTFSNITRLYRKDIEIEYKSNTNGGPGADYTYEINYDAPGCTVALSSTNYNGNSAEYQLLRRVDQRGGGGAGGILEDHYYTDIFNNSTKYEISIPMSIQEYFEFSIYRDFLIGGIRYAWLKMNWSKGINKIILQKYTDIFTDYYTIETRANPTLAGSTSGDGTYMDGEEIVISTIPAPGCTLVNWTDENNVIVSTDLSFNHTVHASKIFTANYDVPKYYIDLTSAPDGSYGSLSGEGWYDALDTCNLGATPNPGYIFVGWFENNVLLSTNPNYSFQVFSNRSLVGQFDKAPNYHITIGVEGVASGIEVGLSGQGYYAGGTTCSVSVSINELQRSGSYTFLGWYENNQLVSTTNPYSFIVNSDRHLVAKFQRKVLITITTKDTNAGDWSGDGYWNLGDDVVLKANPRDGYEFTRWDDLDTYNSSYNNPLIINNIQEDKNFEVIFSSTNSISVIIINNEGGVCTGNGTYNPNDTVILNATPNTGYRFVKWEDDKGNTLSSSNPYSFTATSNITINPIFEKIKYIITTNTNPEKVGSVYGGGNSFYYGDTCNLTATPYTRNYVFSNWTDENDTILSTNNPYSFTVNSNKTITANFIQDSNTYTITISTQYEPDNGTVQFDDIQQTYTITIDSDGNGTVNFN